MESNIYPNETNNIDLSNQTLSSKLTIYTWSHSSEFLETRSIARDNTKHSATSSEGGRLEFLRPKLLYEALRGCWWGFVLWVPRQMDSERRNRGPPWVCPLCQKIRATTWQTNATSVYAMLWKGIYVIEKFVINVLWKGIISYLWVHARARLYVLWKWNIAFLWVLENDFVSTIAGDSDFSWPWDRLHGKIISLSFHAYKERPNTCHMY
jgi:hypothetical protein